MNLERDELADRLGGGLPKGALCVIEGEYGTGKSIILERMLYGFLKNNARVSVVCAVSVPRSDSGSPTTTCSTSRSRTSRRSTSSPRRLDGRGTGAIGVTIVPLGSLTAQPQRALP